MKEDSIVFAEKNQATLPRARARYLAQAIQLEEAHPPNVIPVAVAISLFLLFSLIFWAALTKVSEVAIAEGEVIPAGLIHNVQHLEGGIVSELLVRNGDQVKKGDVLLRFDASKSGPEFEQMRIRRTNLLLQGERLQALVEERDPDFSFADAGYRDLIRKQWTIYQSQVKSKQSELAVTASQIRQRQREITRHQNQVKGLIEERAIYAEQLDLRRSLKEQGAVSKSDILNAKSKLAGAENALRKAMDDIRVAETAKEEAEQRRLELISRHLREVELEAGKVASELAEVEQALVQLKDRVSRLVVKAPTDGIIQGLSVNNQNAVIGPGVLIMQIVPVKDELIVEARILPEDIGHVHNGQLADVKVTSFDSSRFGSLEGTVTQLSATTYLDSEQNPYYRAEVKLTKDHLGNDPKQFKVLPGMTVMAHIRTGEKSILDYLMRPVSRGFDNAFKER